MSSTYISNTLIHELLSKTNIVNLINQQIYLQKKGKNFIACCPFHSEKNPSFTVNVEKQFYYCFSCKSHGNAIDFLMNYHRMTFIESIHELSSIHGITLHHNLIKNSNHTLFQLMNKLCACYKNNLTQKQYSYAYQYLLNRGLNAKTINHFDIGFAPPGWNYLIKTFNSNIYDQKLLEQLGMLVINPKYKYDRFRSRIMFPIRDVLGNIIAFGGRSITNSKTPKYLNSPDTIIFKKSQCLYGLYEARSKNKKLPYILLVEGYIDVIMLTQFGINYSVASLGTSTTTYHIQLLYNITDKIICCYDGDYAGEKAAWNTLSNVLPYLTDNRQIYFVFLPHKDDPDTLIRKIGKEKFLKILTKTQDISQFLFNTLSKKVNLKTLNGRVKLGNLILPILNKIPGKILQLCLIQQLSNKIGILDDTKLKKLLTQKPAFNKHIKNNDIHYNIEHILIGLLIQNPKLAKLVPTTQELKKIKTNNITIFVNLVKICQTHSIITTDQLLKYCHGNEFFSKLEKLASWDHLIKDNMIEITFIETLTKLYNLVLSQRQDMLIARDRVSGLTMNERQELWLLNQKLSKH